jgi:hypothetical protein
LKDLQTMATENHTAGARTPDVIELHDTLSTKLAHLLAALAAISDEGFDGFESLNPGLKRDYLWLCVDLAEQAKAAASRLART